MTLPIVLAATLALAACGESLPIAEPPPGPPRVARRVIPFIPEWIAETDLPRRPQVAPGMVIWEVSEPDPRREATAQERV